MSSLCVYNSLLRIDGQSGVPPIPYGCPNQNFDLWVLELPSNNQDVSYWSSEVSWKIKLCSYRPKETKVVTLPCLLKQMEN